VPYYITFLFPCRQRRREADFQRTLGNYRTSVDTLRQEKQSLLDLQQGGEGEKSDLIASSQKALARAAQLVSDAAAMRKRDAEAVMNQIDQETFNHLATRIESLLPQAVVAPELAAVKGELMVSKAIGKASKSLEGIATSLIEAIRPGLAEMDEADAASAPTVLQLSDTAKQEAATMIHQAEFAHVVVEASSDLLRFLSAGQWPDLLSQDSSIELGSLLGHSVSELDNMFGLLLQSMKEEGILTPERSSIGSLQQTIQTTMQTLRTDIERDDGTLLPASWNPPGWQLMKDASSAKFACLGAAASLSSVLNQLDTASTPPSLVSLYNRLEQASAQSVNVCLRLANLDINNDGLVDELAKITAEWKEKSAAVLSAIDGLLLNGDDMEACNKMAQGALKDLSRLSSALRSANLVPNDDESFHALSPETEDVWDQISRLSRSIRAIDGDEEDVNYMLRARAIEHHLGEAVENEPKLALANAKVASLEKVSVFTSIRKTIYLSPSRLLFTPVLFFFRICHPAPRKLLCKMPDSRNSRSSWQNQVPVPLVEASRLM
jgi:dynactin 1